MIDYVMPLDCVFRLDLRDSDEYLENGTRYIISVTRYAKAQSIDVTIEERRGSFTKAVRKFPYLTKTARDWVDAITLAKQTLEIYLEQRKENGWAGNE